MSPEFQPPEPPPIEEDPNIPDTWDSEDVGPYSWEDDSTVDPDDPDDLW